MQVVRNVEERPRSARMTDLASKHGIQTGAGVIDADYRGPVKVLLFNHSGVDFEGQSTALWISRMTSPLGSAEYEALSLTRQSTRETESLSSSWSASLTHASTKSR